MCPAELRGPAVLPDERPGHRAARGPIPQNDRLALVGQSDGGEVARANSGGGHRLRDHGRDGLPDLLGVVLDPARLRVVLVSSRPALPATRPALS